MYTSPFTNTSFPSLGTSFPQFLLSNVVPYSPQHVAQGMQLGMIGEGELKEEKKKDCKEEAMPVGARVEVKLLVEYVSWVVV